jgi:hypothetical protein
MPCAFSTIEGQRPLAKYRGDIYTYHAEFFTLEIAVKSVEVQAIMINFEPGKERIVREIVHRWSLGDLQATRHGVRRVCRHTRKKPFVSSVCECIDGEKANQEMETGAMQARQFDTANQNDAATTRMTRMRNRAPWPPPSRKLCLASDFAGH